MGERYSLLMDILYRISMWVAGLALLIMVAIIPVGIFARYVMNSALSSAGTGGHYLHGDIYLCRCSGELPCGFAYRCQHGNGPPERTCAQSLLHCGGSDADGYQPVYSLV